MGTFNKDIESENYDQKQPDVAMQLLQKSNRKIISEERKECINKCDGSVALISKNSKWLSMLESLNMFTDDFMETGRE